MNNKIEEATGPQRSFVTPISEYESPATRIRGFKELFEFGLTAPTPMYVLGSDAFTHWLGFGGITPDLDQEIRSTFRDIREKNPTRGAYIGRAFYVPGINNPNGPRTAAITNEDEYVNEVERFFQFVVDNNYHEDEGADIAVVLHPFINAGDRREMYGNRRLKEGEVLPWPGGYAAPDPAPGREQQILIAATFGPDESVQSSPHDEYRVDPERETIFNKTIALKDQTLIPGEGSSYDQFTIPPEFQLEQALTDDEVLRVAKEAHKVFKRRPNARIEFIVQPDGVFIREIAPYVAIDERDLLKLRPGQEVVAPIVRITREEDIARVRGPNAIVYFGPEAFRQRNTDLFARVAHLENIDNLVALVHGSVTTSHMARVLGDEGHSIVLTHDQEYTDGSTYRIARSSDGATHVEALDPYEAAVIPFADVGRLYTGAAGMKVARIALMQHHGIPVPDGFALTTQAIWQYFKDIDLDGQIIRLDAIDAEKTQLITKRAKAIQEKILATPLPKALLSRIDESLSSYGFAHWAIRSSGNEDQSDRSLAGLYTSPTNIATEDVPDKIRATIASYFSPASVQTLLTLEQRPSNMKVGVGVHEFIPDENGSLGAVSFTKPNEIKIEIVHGSPEKLVSGKSQDFLRVIQPRSNGKYTITPVGNPEITVDEALVKEALEHIRQIEQIFQTYQDVELLLSPKRGVVVVQSRPY
jgi:hypothetical protein